MKFKMKDLQDIKFDSNMILGVRDKPGIRTWILLAIQHVFAMFGATVLVPIIVNGALEVNLISTDIALFSSGVGTLIYILVTRAKVPIYLGSSFAYMSALIALFPAYGTSVFLGFLGVGLVYISVALGIYIFGTKWLTKLMPPVIIGPVIMIIGLGLAPTAIQSFGLSGEGDTNWWGIAIGIITIGTAMGTALLSRGKLKLMPFLIAIIVGFALSAIVSSWDDSIIDWSGADWKSWKTYIGAPDFSNSIFLGNSGAANDVAPEGYKWSFMPFFLMMPVAFVTISEHIGDHAVLGKITGRDYINGAPGLHATLIGDGVATMFGGLIGGPANTSYGENTTTVGVSRVGSVYVTGLAAIIAVFMSFFQLIPTVLNLIPGFVFGALSVILYGFIASNGIKTLVNSDIDFSDTRNLFIISTILVIGIGGAVISFTVEGLEIAFEGMSLAMVTGVVLNLALPKDRGIDESKIQK